MVAAEGTASKRSRMMAKMTGVRQLTLLLCCTFLAGACLEPPPSFHLVSLEDARALLSSGEVILVEALAPGEAAGPRPRDGVLWQIPAERPAELPRLPGERPVLVVASSEALGFRAAARLAERGNQPVRVLITRSAEDRGTLYALDPQAEEIPRGRDS